MEQQIIENQRAMCMALLLGMVSLKGVDRQSLPYT